MRQPIHLFSNESDVSWCCREIKGRLQLLRPGASFTAFRLQLNSGHTNEVHRGGEQGLEVRSSKMQPVFTERIVEDWCRLPREVIRAPSLEVFDSHRAMVVRHMGLHQTSQS